MPIFYDFIKDALKDVPDSNFRIPQGIKLVRINPNTGKLSQPGDATVIVEAIKPDYSFDTTKQRVIGGDGNDAMVIDSDAEILQVGGEY